MEIDLLIQKYLKGECSQKEKEELLSIVLTDMNKILTMLRNYKKI